MSRVVRTRVDLSEKTIVVTGASSGIGRGSAIELARAGARVVAVARRGDVLEALVGEIRGIGGQAIPVVADVSSAQDVAAIVAETGESFGRIHVWINNVGIGAIGYFWEVPLIDHARIVEVNLTGVINGAHVAINHFREHGSGVLVNIGSVESEVPLALQSSYAATKAAVHSLSRSLEQELALAGRSRLIRVATLMPWAIDTPWWVHAANYTGRAPRMALLDDPRRVVAAIVQACADPHGSQPVGWKARIANASHHILPKTTERLSALLLQRELAKAGHAPHTAGSIHRTTPEGTAVNGGVRQRMRRE